ncbi:hypothetical protein EZJ58_2188 [Sodalis ligni]|uniref:Uncharacterized protein n=1 Tax=Sodalis ligni TaxID=2697027 RepID=A0A4R1NIR4_9GAMM|nr:hypothetical protein EZJ58_2188 [Sodalis ligni]
MCSGFMLSQGTQPFSSPVTHDMLYALFYRHPGVTGVVLA